MPVGLAAGSWLGKETPLQAQLPTPSPSFTRARLTKEDPANRRTARQRLHTHSHTLPGVKSSPASQLQLTNVTPARRHPNARPRHVLDGEARPAAWAVQHWTWCAHYRETAGRGRAGWELAPWAQGWCGTGTGWSCRGVRLTATACCPWS
jgi:hypothetical protein